jgi:hypothetical protein
MTIELTTHQQRLLDAIHDQPPQIVDPRTKTAYILIRSDEYELIRILLEEEKVQRAISRIALRNAIECKE